jgi:predicted GTPase
MNLVLLEGNKATLYVDGQDTQVVVVDYSQPLGRIKKDIEYFRVNGIDFERTNNERE